MSNTGDFVIENGVLEKYKGPGGDVVIPEGVTRIGREAFQQDREITSVIIPKSVTSIGMGAFSDCINLTFVSIPEGMKKIGSFAFDNCIKLSQYAGL